MSRAVAFLVRNWPLKLGAIGLATVLYAGLVVSQNAQTWSGQVPIQPLGQPSGVFLLDNPGAVTFIRLYAPPDVARQLSNQDFSATIDLSGIQASANSAPTTVPVQLTALDDRIQILDFRPRQVPVRLDPIISKDVPVTVDHGVIPPGLQLGNQVIAPATVTVRGGSTLVAAGHPCRRVGHRGPQRHQRRLRRRHQAGGRPGRCRRAGERDARPRPRPHRRDPGRLEPQRARDARPERHAPGRLPGRERPGRARRRHGDR